MAYVLSSVSGNLISAASAGFAPTNSADVSAIASAYQVVSATATQLYAGTSYVTSVNDNQLSAARAGQAANASMANSAYYDGTGRLISALPDSAAVSSIASAYAESAASSKLDTSALDKWQTGDEPVWAYSGINGIPIHPTAADYAHEADYAESADSATYAESADYWLDASSKQDALTFGYDAEDKISGINGSAIAGGAGAEYSGIAPIHVDNDTHEISADVVNMDLQQITHDDTMVHVSNSASYALGVNTSAIPYDVTTLWTGTGTTTGGTITLSESLNNFERYGMYYYIPYQESSQEYYQEMVYKSGQTTFGIKTDGINSTIWRQYIDYGTMNETSISIVSGRQGGFWLTGTDRSFNLYDGNDRHHYFTKVVGIHRTAEA